MAWNVNFIRKAKCKTVCVGKFPHGSPSYFLNLHFLLCVSLAHFLFGAEMPLSCTRNVFASLKELQEKRFYKKAYWIVTHKATSLIQPIHWQAQIFSLQNAFKGQLEPKTNIMLYVIYTLIKNKRQWEELKVKLWKYFRFGYNPNSNLYKIPSS